MSQPVGPHGRIAVSSLRERFLAEMFDSLWDTYRRRVEYVRMYEDIVARAGGTFVNDHSAFRTFATQNPTTGIASIARLFDALGYRAAGCYAFEDTHLSAVHLQHSNSEFPKIFISELKAWELPRHAREIINATLASHRRHLSEDLLHQLATLDENSGETFEKLLWEVLDWFHTLPWDPPAANDVGTLNAESQYAAWVLVHGYNVNHFTSLINSHGVAALGTIEQTVAALDAVGVPMKDCIDGRPGSVLRQTATKAAVIDVATAEGSMPWTYAYFELAQRGVVIDSQTGRSTRFDGFLGPQATNLFEMTRKEPV